MQHYVAHRRAWKDAVRTNSSRPLASLFVQMLTEPELHRKSAQPSELIVTLSGDHPNTSVHVSLAWSLPTYIRLFLKPCKDVNELHSQAAHTDNLPR
jgi:hypothetical protein